MRKIVNARWRGQEWCLRCRRKTGKRPKTSMLKSVKLNTWVVEGNREASTVLAMSAAFVEREAGNLRWDGQRCTPCCLDVGMTYFASGPAP